MFRGLEVPARLTLRQGKTPAQTRATPCATASRARGPVRAPAPCPRVVTSPRPVQRRCQGRAGQQGWHSPECAALVQEIRRHQYGPGCPPRQSHCSLTACHIFNFLCLRCWTALDCSSICSGPWRRNSPFAGSFLIALTAPRPAAKQSGEDGWGFQLSISLMSSLKICSSISPTRHGTASPAGVRVRAARQQRPYPLASLTVRSRFADAKA